MSALVTEFIGAALPWIAMGLLLAVFFARGARRKKGKSEEYGSEERIRENRREKRKEMVP